MGSISITKNDSQHWMNNNHTAGAASLLLYMHTSIKNPVLSIVSSKIYYIELVLYLKPYPLTFTGGFIILTVYEGLITLLVYSMLPLLKNT